MVGPREPGPDLVRIVGLAAIVIGHVYAADQGVRLATYTWHVPVFFIITGYLWRPRRPLRDDAVRRVRTLLVPYISWLGLLFVFDGSRHRALLGGSYATGPFTAFWFVTALFTAVVLYRLLERTRPTIRVGALVAGLTVNLVAGSALACVPWSVGTALGAVAFVGAGQLLRWGQQRAPRQSRPWAAFALLTIAIVLVTTHASEPMDMKVGDFGTPVVSVLVATAIGFALILLAEELAPLLWAGARRTMASVASVGLVIVLLHILVLYRAPAHLLGGRLTLAVLAFALPLATGSVAQRTIVAPLLVGRSRR